jgi:hypothetical protein
MLIDERAKQIDNDEESNQKFKFHLKEHENDITTI